MTEQEAKKLVDKYWEAVSEASKAYRLMREFFGTSQQDEAISKYNYCLLKEERAYNELVAELVRGKK